MAQIDEILDDTLSISADAIALAVSYQFALADVVGYSDQIRVETNLGTGATDAVSTLDRTLISTGYDRSPSDGSNLTDQVLVAMFYGVSPSDLMSVVDAIYSGRVDDAFSTDLVTLTETTNLSSQYNRVSSDGFETTDEVYPWVDGVLQISFQGDGVLNAVALYQEPIPATQPVVPPKTKILLKLPADEIRSYVIDPHPTRKRE